MSVPVFNMTGFFNRELFMYSLGDIRFKKPVSLKKVAYITVFLIIWVIPMFAIFGIIFTPAYLAIMFIPPIILGTFASRPVWGGGRGLLDFLKVLTGFMQQPKGWTDHNADNDLESQTFYIKDEIWISRRREMIKLAQEARAAREAANPPKNKKSKGKKKKA